jgi:hypothetical protein
MRQICDECGNDSNLKHFAILGIAKTWCAACVRNIGLEPTGKQGCEHLASAKCGCEPFAGENLQYAPAFIPNIADVL